MNRFFHERIRMEMFNLFCLVGSIVSTIYVIELHIFELHMTDPVLLDQPSEDAC